MRGVELPDEPMTHFASDGVLHRPLARVLGTLDGFAVDVQTVAAGGRHPTRLWQLFTVVSGEGWVSGADGRAEPIRAGEAVLWEPDEDHESGSHTGMVAVVVQTAVVPSPR